MQNVDDMYPVYQHVDICLPTMKELDHFHTMNAGSTAFYLLTNRGCPKWWNP